MSVMRVGSLVRENGITAGDGDWGPIRQGYGA